jgi:RNA polymerase sigma-70 factor, ECF subfamily
MYPAETVRYAECIIRDRVSRLIGHAGFTEEDREDLQQELMSDVLDGLKLFNPACGTIGTFLARLVERRILTRTRNRRASKRNFRRNGPSLNEEIQDANGDTVELAETIDTQTVHPGHTDTELLQLATDLKRVLADLPEDERNLCLRLKTQSVREISAETGISVATLYGKIASIRRRLKKAGMAGYFG